MELNPLYSNIVAVVAIVAGLALGAWWIAGLYWMPSRKQEEELPEGELPGHIHDAFMSVPAAFAIFVVFIVVALISYVLYIWLSGASY